MPLASYAGSAVFGPTRALFRAVIRAGSTAKDEQVGDATAVASVAELRSAYEGKRALVVGGTRGIGAAIAGTLREAGASVTIVGRSCAPVMPGDGNKHHAFAADLSTVSGCRRLAADLVADMIQMVANEFVREKNRREHKERQEVRSVPLKWHPSALGHQLETLPQGRLMLNTHSNGDFTRKIHNDDVIINYYN